MGTPSQSYRTSLAIYGITQCYLPPDKSELVPPNPRHAGWYSITYPGGMEGWVDLVDLHSALSGSRTGDLSITSSTPNHCTTKTWMIIQKLGWLASPHDCCAYASYVIYVCHVVRDLMGMTTYAAVLTTVERFRMSLKLARGNSHAAPYTIIHILGPCSTVWCLCHTSQSERSSIVAAAI